MLIVLVLATIGFLLFNYNISLIIKNENYKQKAKYEYLRYKHNAEKDVKNND